MKEHSWGENNILSYAKDARQLLKARDDDSIPFPPPRFVSIWISEVCNLDCTYCYFSETNYDKQHQYIPFEPMLKWLLRMKQFGAEALEFSGGGEPTLHPEFKEFLFHGNKMGYQMGVITHACNDMPVEEMVRRLRYVRCGLDAASTKMHAQQWMDVP